MNRSSASYRRLKRGSDLVLSSVLLLLALPFLGLIALAILIDDGRPFLFRQTRSGLHGRPFTILKFRTLRSQPHRVTDPLAAVTRTGRFLRRWGLDELPQLWNVLRGDMSLVGPRPTLPSQVSRYGAFERRRLEMRPGLTGWAQIHGRNALDWNERIRLDIDYVDAATLRMDLAILARTPSTLLTGHGVYGQGGTNGDFGSSGSQNVPVTTS